MKQKLLIGDDSGTLSCYEFRKGEPQVVFQTKVFDGPISCVALGGNSPKKDKVLSLFYNFIYSVFIFSCIRFSFHIAKEL